MLRNIIYFEDDENSNDLINDGIWCQKTAINSDIIKTNFKNMEFTLNENKFSLKDLPLIGNIILKIMLQQYLQQD